MSDDDGGTVATTTHDATNGDGVNTVPSASLIKQDVLQIEEGKSDVRDKPYEAAIIDVDTKKQYEFYRYVANLRHSSAMSFLI